MDDRCSNFAIKVNGLLYDIKSKLTKYRLMKSNNDPDIDNLIRDIYNGYLVQMGMIPVFPKSCGENILDFIQNLIRANPNWSTVRGWTGTQIYTDSLKDDDVVEIIKKVQEKIDSRDKKGIYTSVSTAGRRSFKKRTTSTRKSIKRSRRHRNRRTARK